MLAALRLYRKVLATGPASWLGVAVLAMVGSLLEGVALVILAQTVALDTANDQGAENRIAVVLSHLMSWLGLHPSIQLFLVGFALAAALSSLFTFFSNVATHAICARTERSMRSQLFNALLEVDWATLTSQRAGEVLKSLTADPEKVTLGIRSLLIAISSAASAAVYLLAASAVSPLLTLVMGGFVFVLWPFHVVVVGYNARISNRMNTLERGLFNRATHAFNDAKTIFSLGLRPFIRQDYMQTLGSYTDATFRKDTSLEIARLVYETLAVIFIGFLLWVTIGLGGRLSNALIVLAIFYRMAPKVIYLQDAIYRVLNQAEWVEQWLGLVGQLGASRRLRHEGARQPFEKSLELRGVTFRYPERPEPVLRNVDLKLGFGECVAITGVSGSGKTTVIDLITGLCRPSEGQVLVDGRPLEELDEGHWQSQIGLVLQSAALFYGSVGENVAYGKEREGAALKAALVKAGMADFIQGLPEGVETQVGEQGVQLSGGQRQRLAIARAFYRKPRLLILDEATSALDQENHAWISQMVREHKGEIAILIVAHGGELLSLADRSYSLQDGVLTEKAPS